jgi:hypothetical protein
MDCANQQNSVIIWITHLTKPGAVTTLDEGLDKILLKAVRFDSAADIEAP